MLASYQVSLNKQHLIIVLGACACLGLFLFWFNPTSYWWTPKCPMHLLTGFSCPACGIQRFFHALLLGHPLTALRYNYYLLYALPYAMAFVVAWVMQDCECKRRLTAVIEHRWMVWFYIITFMIWMIVRNIYNL